MDRRKFLGWVGVGMLATNLPVLIAACSAPPNSDTVEETESKNTEIAPNNAPFLTIGTAAKLAQEGYLLDAKNNVIVIVKPDKSLAALNSKCTHNGCTVGWDKTASSINCDCHGSVFSTNGKVIKGPAKEALAVYEVKEENGSILVKV